MRLVLDTDVMVAAIRSDAGASRRILRAALERQRGLTILASVPLLIEYEATMGRPVHLGAAGLTAEELGVLLDAVAAIVEPVILDFHWRPSLVDADDDMVLEAAINGRADAIVTFNARHFRPASQSFAVAILSPRQALVRLELQP